MYKFFYYLLGAVLLGELLFIQVLIFNDGTAGIVDKILASLLNLGLAIGCIYVLHDVKSWGPLTDDDKD